MKKKGKPWHFAVMALLICVFAFTAFFGVSSTYGDIKTVYIKGASDIRFGIDIRGGVDVTFVPADGYDATPEQMQAAKTVIEDRLVSQNITDSEVYTDEAKDRIIVRFPWKEGESGFDPETAIQELGATAQLTFRKGTSADGEIVLEGSDVRRAAAAYGPLTANGVSEYYVQLELEDSGKTKFAEATTELAQENGQISIWMDDQMISAPYVNTAITDGVATISGSFTQESAVSLADRINSGALPFALSADSYSTISPTLGTQSLEAMLLAGISGRRTFVIALLTGFVEVAGTFLGYFAAMATTAILPLALSFAGGTMLYIVSDEMIPETHSHGYEKLATFSMMAGFFLMILMNAFIS